MISKENIPVNWAIATLAQCISARDIISDGDWIETKDQDPNGEVRLIQLADIGDGTFRNKSNRFMTKNNAMKLNCTFLKTGDVLIARMPDPLGRACIFPGVGQESVTVVDVCLVRSSIASSISNSILKYWINSPEIRNLIAMQATGTTRKRITRKKLEALELPLPPLAEQKQIATKLDELLAQVDTIKTRLDAIPTILKRFRQTVLAAAVNGKLTEEWRKNHKDSILIKSCLNNIGLITGGKTPSKSNPDYWATGTIPWVSPKDMKVDEIVTSKNLITDLAITEAGMKFIPVGSVLMVTRSGILAHTFPVAITKSEVTINQDIKAFIPDVNIVSAQFVFVLLRGLSQKILFECSKTGTTVPSVGTELLANLEFTLPSLEEQKEVVSQVENFFNFIDQIEKQVNSAQTRVNNLTQSILAKAFRGDLTAEWREQNPDSKNSAEALLENIKIERADAAMQKKSVRRKIKKKSDNTMKTKNIIPVLEALKSAKKPLTSQQLLAESGYPGDASVEQLETFFLDIREQVDLGVVARERRGDEELLSLVD